MSDDTPARHKKPRHSRPTKVPGIPKPPRTTSPELKRYLENLSEAVQIRLGRQGDTRDRAVTLRELIDSGLATDLADSNFNPENPSNPDFKPPDGNLPGADNPTKPANFRADGGYSSIVLAWDYPAYYGHSLTEIYRNSVDNRATATQIALTPGTMYVDYTGNGVTFYYWVRFVSETNVKGDWSDMASAMTSLDVNVVLDAINGQISYDSLADDLLADIDRIETLDTFVGLSDPQTGLAGTVAQNTTDITDQGVTLTDQIETGLQAADDNLQIVSGRVDQIELEVGPDGANASSIDAIYAVLYPNGDPTQPLASSTYTDVVDVKVTNLSGIVYTEGLQLDNLQATVNDSDTGLAATVQKLSTVEASVDGVKAQHTIKVSASTGDGANVIAGIGLIAEADVAGPYTSAVYVLANRFAVIGSSAESNGPSPVSTPFTVYTAGSSSGGVSWPAGVYITDAYIRNASIVAAKIGSVNADTITTGFLGAARIQANTITANKLDFGVGAEITTNGSGGIVIRDAVIDTANIIDARVTTLKIKDEAVVVSNITTVTTELTVNSSSWTELGKIGLNPEGGKAVGTCSSSVYMFSTNGSVHFKAGFFIFGGGQISRDFFFSAYVHDSQNNVKASIPISFTCESPAYNGALVFKVFYKGNNGTINHLNTDVQGETTLVINGFKR